MNTIYLDTRETNHNFVASLIDSSIEMGYDIKMNSLEFGDIKYQNIHIERKQCNDFCSSVCSNRLWDQAYKMKINKDYVSIIIISGGWDELWKDNLDKIPQLEGAIVQLLAWGIPVIRVRNDIELINKTFEIFAHSKPIDIPIKRVEKDIKSSIFRALPGVGEKNSKVLMSNYGNICELCEASQKELQLLLGPKKGKDIYDALRK